MARRSGHGTEAWLLNSERVVAVSRTCLGQALSALAQATWPSEKVLPNPPPRFVLKCLHPTTWFRHDFQISEMNKLMGSRPWSAHKPAVYHEPWSLIFSTQRGVMRATVVYTNRIVQTFRAIYIYIYILYIYYILYICIIYIYVLYIYIYIYVFFFLFISVLLYIYIYMWIYCSHGVKIWRCVAFHSDDFACIRNALPSWKMALHSKTFASYSEGIVSGPEF